MGTVTVTLRNRSLDPDAWYDLCFEFLHLLRELTPVDTGFCQDSWQDPPDISDTDATFFNDCDYASFLDDGWSDQAPDGMTRPARQQLPDLVQKYK